MHVNIHNSNNCTTVFTAGYLGLLHERMRVWTPPPHVREHALAGPHSPHPPCTCSDVRVLITRNVVSILLFLIYRQTPNIIFILNLILFLSQ